MRNPNQSKNELAVLETGSSSFPIQVQANDLELADYQLDEEQFDFRLIQFLIGLLRGTASDSPWIQYLQKEVNLTNLEDLAFVPMICQSNVSEDPKNNCPYANVCPLMRKLRGDKEARKALVGTECRIEKARIVKLFASLVNNLNITPVQTTDLLALTKLVQSYILENRLIWELNMRGMIHDIPAVVSQKDGRVFYKPESNPAEKMLERIRKQIDNLNAQLLASRKDRAALANTMSKNPSFSKLLTGTALSKNFSKAPSLESLEMEEVGEIGEIESPLLE